MEFGLVFSEPDRSGDVERGVIVTFDDGTGWAGAALVMFGGLNHRCGDGSTTYGSLERTGVEVAPRHLWGPIAATLIPEQPTDYFLCDAMGERTPGRTVLSANEAAVEGDDWISGQVATSPLLRYRWRTEERDPELDSVLERIRDAEDVDAVALARSLQRRELGRWSKKFGTRGGWAASAVRNLCIETSTVAFHDQQRQDEASIGWDSPNELRRIASSMLGGPLYIPGSWAPGLDRILARLDESPSVSSP
ncbi:hypothetical protein GCM10009846_22410 [Agrococcus versicolor]|uniref:Uncharacterized protein n=1 Tax=Agrococcus versicolor TaxID=501482 RepID=A0ABN3AUV7_9MICO